VSSLKNSLLLLLRRHTDRSSPSSAVVRNLSLEQANPTLERSMEAFLMASCLQFVQWNAKHRPSSVNTRYY